MTVAATSQRRQQVSTTVGLLIGGLAFFLTLLNYSRDLTRTALAAGYFSHFFDLQARAILDGRLSVPDGSLGLEGFIHDGKTYTYFPPFPALLRLPVLMTTHEYDARLTVLSMTIAWIVFAVALTKLFWLLRTLVMGTEEVTWTQAGFGALFIAGASGGTFLTYDAASPYVFHEVYIWAVAAAVGALYWMTRVLLRPDTNSVKWLFTFALICVGCRATEGWAVSLTVIAIGLFMRFRPTTPEHRRLWLRILLAGAVPLAVSIIINEVKFGNVYLFPLETQVWTQLSEQRRFALDANGGTLSGPQFFPTSFMAYLRPDGVRFVDYFPWVTMPAEPAAAYNGAVIDQTYRTGSATGFMPLFLLMEAVSLVLVFRPRAEQRLRALRWPMVTGIMVTGGVMGYGYYATRYTSEFVPALVFGGALCTCLLARAVEKRRRLRWPALGLVAVGVTYSILAMMAIGLMGNAYLHRGDPLVRYVELQHEISPEATARHVSQVPGLPVGGHTDDLAISQDCQALYIHTGDLYEPWISVQERDRVLKFEYDIDDLTEGAATLLTVETTKTHRVDVQVSARHQVRFVIYSDGRVFTQPWFDPPTDGEIRFGIRNRIEYKSYQFETSPGGELGFLPSVYFRGDDSLPSLLSVTEDPSTLEDLGFTVTAEPGLPLKLCTELAESAGIDVTD